MKAKVCLTAIFLFVYIFSLRTQTEGESHIVISGDSTLLNISNYTSGDIQWQEKDSLLGTWKNLPGANDTFVIVDFLLPSTPEKYYRAILTNGPNGETYFTDAIKFDVRQNFADILVGEKYAGGHVFINQDSFLYIVGETELQSYWGCYGTEINGADGVAIGDGVQNTLDIIQQCQEDSTAAWLCDKFEFDGFDDWYLPSIGELNAAMNFLLDNDLYILHNGLRYWMSSTESVAFPVSNIEVLIINENDDYVPSFGILNKQHNACCNRFKTIRRQNHAQNIFSSYNLSFKDVSETEQILVAFPDSNNSFVQIQFDGLTNSNDQFEWDFQGGEKLAGDSIGPYLIGYDFGGYRTVKLAQYTQNGDTIFYESEPFRPRLFRQHPLKLPRFYLGTFSVADFDNDGFEDFLLSGQDTTQLYRNLNGENFAPISANLPNLRYAFSDFGDFDNDGFPDLLLSGYDDTDSVYLTKVYHNVPGAGWEEQDVQIPGLANGFCEWTDYDRDGLADFLVSGETMDSTAYTGLFRGNGNGTFEEMLTPFENVSSSTGAFGDYNNDNFPDLVISGSRDSMRFAKLYRNEQGEFVETAIDILPVDNGSASWVDYNNDGWLDFSVSGNQADIVMNPYPMANSNDYNNVSAVSFRHYRNLEDGNFKPSGNGSLGNQFVKSAQATADIDNDGLEDIFITGQSAIMVAVGGTGGGSGSGPVDKNHSRIILYKSLSTDSTISFNNRNVNVPDQILTDNSFSIPPYHIIRGVKLFDFNRDGRPDLLRGGATSEYPTALYTNTIYRSNTAPTAPKNLLHDIISCDSIFLSWEHASDDLTPEAALVYDLYIGTVPGAGDVLSSANNDQLQNNWFRLNRPLEKGTYYWSVRARDGARIFGEWATEASFTIGVPTPTVTFDGMQLISDAMDGNQWYNENGVIPDATESTYEPTEDGIYYCIVTDMNGCVSDTSNVIEVDLTGLTEMDVLGFRIFPNPFGGELHIESTYNETFQIQIIANDGKILEVINHFRGSTVINLAFLPSGQYSIRFLPEEGSPIVYQLTKK